MFRSKMPAYCCVPQCTNANAAHRFPRDETLRKVWILAIKRQDPDTKRPWQPSQYSRVCKEHFSNSDYKETTLLSTNI